MYVGLTANNLRTTKPKEGGGRHHRLHVTHSGYIVLPSRVDLPAQANFLRCARIATIMEPFQGQRPHGIPTKHASGLGLGLGFRVGVVAAVSRSRKQSHRRAKNPSQSSDKICFIKTVSFHAGKSEEVRLCGPRCTPAGKTVAFFL